MRLCEIESKLNKLSRIPSSSDDTDDFVSHYSNLQDYSNLLLNASKYQKVPNGFNGINHQGIYNCLAISIAVLFPDLLEFAHLHHYFSMPFSL